MPGELCVLVGLQASGKTTFCRQAFAGTHARVSKDDFPNARHRQGRQMRLIEEALRAGHSVVVDNTNPSDGAGGFDVTILDGEVGQRALQ